MSSGHRFPPEKSQGNGGLREQRRQHKRFFLPMKLHRDLPSGKEWCQFEWSPLRSAETPLGTGRRYLCLLWLSTGVITAARGVSRLRDYDDHDEVTCREFNLMICPVPSTPDPLLTSSGWRESLRSIMRPHLLVRTHPIHTCATYFLPCNLESHGIISQWLEMALFSGSVGYFFY